MAFDYQSIKNWRFEPIRQELATDQAILYALAVGYGFEPLDRRQLCFVYEQGLLAAPTLATVLAHPGFWMRYPAAGVDWKQVVHTAQRLVLQSRTPPPPRFPAPSSGARTSPRSSTGAPSRARWSIRSAS